MSDDKTKCADCNGTGYWSNCPPKPGAPLEMGDCCGVCSGKGFLTAEDTTDLTEPACPNGHPMGRYDANCDHGCIGQ